MLAKLLITFLILITQGDKGEFKVSVVQVPNSACTQYKSTIQNEFFTQGRDKEKLIYIGCQTGNLKNYKRT